MPPARKCDCGACKRCKHREYMNKWYQDKTPAERRAWTAKRDPDLARARYRAAYAKNPKRQYPKPRLHETARNAVYRAKRRGDLVPEPCLFCDSTENIIAHHHDYTLPLEVTWLCRRHHGRVHHEINRAAEAA
jgi:hypothetical protein